MGDRPSTDKRFQKINVNRKIQRGKCCGGAQETSAYSRHGVAKAKIDLGIGYRVTVIQICHRAVVSWINVVLFRPWLLECLP